MDDERSSLLRLLADDRFQAWVTRPTPDLDRYWEQRLRDQPEERVAVQQARRLLQQLDFKKSPRIDREGILIGVHDRAARDRAAHEWAARDRARRPLQRNWHWAAAVVVGLLAAAAYGYFLPSTQTHTTAYGESERIVLPDGSTVVLNANSQLSYPDDWSREAPRQVILTGEAFFSVTHQANRQKFIVRTNDLAIEVLGTEFNVNHRRGETEVVLQTGSIRLDWSAGGEVSWQAPSDLVIAPGEMVVFSQDQRDVRRAVVNPTLYSSWTQDRWLFDKTPLAEVFTMIEDNYGLRVKAAPNIARKVFTAEVDHADLDLLLDFLSESFDLAITKNQQTIIIEQK